MMKNLKSGNKRESKELLNQWNEKYFNGSPAVLVKRSSNLFWKTLAIIMVLFILTLTLLIGYFFYEGKFDKIINSDTTINIKTEPNISFKSDEVNNYDNKFANEFDFEFNFEMSEEFKEELERIMREGCNYTNGSV